MSEYEFFRDVQIDQNGSVVCVVVDTTGMTPIITENDDNAYDFFHYIELDNQGRMKITTN